MAEETASGDAYDIVLADLKAQRDRIDAAIAAIMAFKGQGTSQNQSVTSSEGAGNDSTVAPILPPAPSGLS